MTGYRLRTDIWVSALRRRAESAGAFVSIARRGSPEAGAVFVLVGRGDGSFDLYGPAPQSVFKGDGSLERLFSPVARAASEEQSRVRMEQELRFDPDLWLVDIQDREGRHFLDLVADPPAARFTSH